MKAITLDSMHYFVVVATAVLAVATCFLTARYFGCELSLPWSAGTPSSDAAPHFVDAVFPEVRVPLLSEWLHQRRAAATASHTSYRQAEDEEEVEDILSLPSIRDGGSLVSLLLHSLREETQLSARRALVPRQRRQLQEREGATGNVLAAYPPCESTLTDYTPCQDPETMKKYHGAERMDRHCPKRAPECLVPAPVGYRKTVKWPASRDEAWYVNVPHKHLTSMKADQNWIRYDERREVFTFPGGGTMFHHGAEEYLRGLERLVPLRNGSIRTVLDTGCGVGSFGAYLLSRNVLTMSLAPRDGHEAQVQFALERGLPAMLGVLAKNRLPYPARAFDLAHCSRCLIPWSADDGRLLAEIDRVLRPGGFWVLTGPPIDFQHYARGWNRTVEDLRAEQERLEAAAARLCWRKFVEEGMFAVWQKPSSANECLRSAEKRESVGETLPVCEDEKQADLSWYTPMAKCIAPLPPSSDVQPWPARLSATPPRIAQGLLQLPASGTAQEGRDLAGADDGAAPLAVTEADFQADTEQWQARVEFYRSTMLPALKQGEFRNLMDANAGLGSFAAALAQDPVWVMNVVPVEGPGDGAGERARLLGGRADTLGVVFERGLLGSYHDWCEAFSTYPRTYDLIHAHDLLSAVEASGRCPLPQVLLEWDRILRPEGVLIVDDSPAVLHAVRERAVALRWDAREEEVPALGRAGQKQQVLVCTKKYWTDA